MDKIFEEEKKSLLRELETIQSIVRLDRRFLEDKFLHHQIRFWTESTRFCIGELKIWDQENDIAKCQQAINKARECLDKLQQVIS